MESPRSIIPRRKVAPYGTWKSPITADLLSSHSIRFSDLAVSASGKAYVVETRSGGEDDGRNAIVEWPSETTESPRDVLPAPNSAMTKIHGYGGGAITVNNASGHIVFSNSGSGVWSLDPVDCRVSSILETTDEIYYADFDVRNCGKWILAVREDHRGADNAAGVVNCVVAINSETGQEKVIAGGADFFTHPRFSPDGSKVSFLRWNNPDMPWTGTEMLVFRWDNRKGQLMGRPLYKDGRPGEISIAQPRWGLDETLFYASDRSGTWQMECVDFTKKLEFWEDYSSRSLRLLGLEDGDLAEPEWEIGSSTHVQLNKTTLIATWTKNAREQLVLVDLETGQCRIPSWSLTGIKGNSLRRINDSEIMIIGSTPTCPLSIYRLSTSRHLHTSSLPDPLRSSLAIPIDPSYYSRAMHIDIPRKDAVVVDREGTDSSGSFSRQSHSTCHAYYLPPTNPAYTAPPSTLPPLVVITHEGPTQHSGPGLALRVQFFTSRGFAVALANPLGSSGYGRGYREALNSHWGIADAADVAACVEHITRTLGWADSDRVGTVGGSAGGYVTLQALYKHPDLWRGGVSYYGISDVRKLIAGTHKFESWYARRLLFGAQNPEPDKSTMDRIFHERSARYHVDEICAPLLLLQGDADEIVPLDQAKEMEDAMRQGGKKVKLVAFKDEGHGFIRADTVLRATREEQAWWVMNLVRSGKEEMEVEDRWIWVDEPSGDEAGVSTA